MKKFILMALVFVPIFLLTTNAYASQINVSIDGQLVDFAGQAPVIVDGRTLAPIRDVFETLGFEVTWDAALNLVTLTNDDYVVRIGIGRRGFSTNYRSHSFDVPAQIIGDRTLLPIRALLESIGYRVAWNESTQTIIAHSKSFRHSNTSDVEFNVEYHNNRGFIFSENLIIRSVDELLKVAESQIGSNRVYPNPMINYYFLDITSEFDEDFFAEKMLILTTRFTSTGMAGSRVDGVSLDEDSIITVNFTITIPDGFVTANVGVHFYIISVPHIEEAIIFSTTGWS